MLNPSPTGTPWLPPKYLPHLFALWMGLGGLMEGMKQMDLYPAAMQQVQLVWLVLGVAGGWLSAGPRTGGALALLLGVALSLPARAEQMALFSTPLPPAPSLAPVQPSVEAPITLGVVALLVPPAQHVEAGAMAYVNLFNLGPVGLGPVLLLGASLNLKGLPGTTRVGAGLGARLAQGPWGLGGVAALASTDPAGGGLAPGIGVWWAMAVPGVTQR